MTKCINCGAPLPPDTIVCEYCGSRNDTDLMGVHTYTTNEPDSERTCPKCGIPMKTIDLKLHGKFYIERCDTCLGLFFDPGELEVLLNASVKNVFHINRKKLDRINATMAKPDQPITYVKCPVCGKVMNRVNFGARSGVVVDRCAAHGVWLNGGELRHLFEWMKAGGEILDQEVREADINRREAETDKKEKALMAAEKQGVPFQADGFMIYDNEFVPEGRDLFQILQGVVRWFMK